jgi:hypothetical protein
MAVRFIVAAIITYGVLLNSNVAASQAVRSIKCDQPLPEFTLGENSQPTDEQVSALCACIWDKLPEKGWERRTSALIKAGEDAGWRARPFMARFSSALEDCGGMQL